MLAGWLERHATDPTATVQHPADLFLAAGCAAGHQAALEIFERLLSEVRPAIHGIVAAHEIDEVVQTLRVHLMVGGEDRRPRIGDYSGRGPLRAFLRIALVRAALSARRASRAAPVDEEAWLSLPALTLEPDLVALHRRCAPAFRAALEEAIGRLIPRERTLLRQHIMDGLSGADLARLYRVHRATALRWIAEIKGKLVIEVRSELASRLALGEQDLDSLVRSLRSQFALSVERVLAAESPAQENTGRPRSPPA